MSSNPGPSKKSNTSSGKTPSPPSQPPPMTRAQQEAFQNNLRNEWANIDRGPVAPPAVYGNPDQPARQWSQLPDPPQVQPGTNYPVPRYGAPVPLYGAPASGSVYPPSSSGYAAPAQARVTAPGPGYPPPFPGNPPPAPAPAPALGQDYPPAFPRNPPPAQALIPPPGPGYPFPFPGNPPPARALVPVPPYPYPGPPNEIPGRVRSNMNQPGQGVFQANVGWVPGRADPDPDPAPAPAPVQGKIDFKIKCRCDLPFSSDQAKVQHHWERTCPYNPALGMYPCRFCGKELTRKDNLIRHEKTCRAKP